MLIVLTEWLPLGGFPCFCRIDIFNRHFGLNPLTFYTYKLTREQGLGWLMIYYFFFCHSITRGFRMLALQYSPALFSSQCRVLVKAGYWFYLMEAILKIAFLHNYQKRINTMKHNKGITSAPKTHPNCFHFTFYSNC